MLWLAVAVAGAAGAACRYVVDFAVTARTGGAFPLGTLVVNLSGSFLVGVVAGAVAGARLPAGAGAVLAGGFCGAYTTMSTLTYETWRLAEDGAWAAAAANLASVALGALAAAAGWVLLAP